MEATERTEGGKFLKLSVEAALRIGVLALMTAVGASKSNGEARRLVEGGGVYLNNERIADTGRM